jgi:hypothetical protein
LGGRLNAHRASEPQAVKTEVTFSISNPIAFSSEESYSHLGIEISILDGKLVALQTIVEHEVEAGRDEVVSKARSAAIPLLTLIEYSCGIPVNIGGIHTHAIEPVSEASSGLGFIKIEAALARHAPMPPAEILANLTEVTRLQMDWYLLGHSSPSVIERIQSFYKVLEQEQRITAGGTSPYIPPAEATYLRHAVSHPELDDPKVVRYLQASIGSPKIDPKNESHIRFLEGQLRLLQSEAQRILDAKVPKWW